MTLSPTTRDRPVWLHVGTLLDGTSTKPAHDTHIVYDAGEILFVGRNGELPARELLRTDQTTPDFIAPDYTLLPGLIEAHAHLFLEGGELALEKRAAYIRRSSEDLLSEARKRLEKLIRLGITAVRDAGDKDGIGLALSKLYSSGNRPLMPYVESPGAAIHHRGRYGSFMGEPLEDFPSPHDCVAVRVKAGADRIKLIPTGIIDFKKGQVTSAPQMTLDEVRQLVAAAKFFRRQTFAHASGDTGIDYVIDGGVDSVEHGFFVRDDQLAKMRDRQTAWVPTFAPVQKQIDHADVMGWTPEIITNLRKIIDSHSSSLVKAHSMGVLIVAGSDAGSVGVAHGVGLLYEVELMERAGLPALSIVNAATGVSSARLGYKEKFGRIAPGYLSRFILTKHSPLETVTNLRKARTVVFDGAIFETGDATDVHGL